MLKQGSGKLVGNKTNRGASDAKLTHDHKGEFEPPFDAFSVDLIGEIGESDVAIELLDPLTMLRCVPAAVQRLRRLVTVHHVVVRGHLIGFAEGENESTWLLRWCTFKTRIFF